MSLFEKLKEVLRDLLDSEDSEGCSDDLTVVSRNAMTQLRLWRLEYGEDNPYDEFALVSDLDANIETDLESKNTLDAIDEALGRMGHRVVRRRAPDEGDASGAVPKKKPNAHRKFKVWVSIEAIDEAADKYYDLMDHGLLEPISLGQYLRLRDAWIHILNLPTADTHPSDWSTLARTDGIERKVWKKNQTHRSPHDNRDKTSQDPTPAARAEYLRTGGVRCPYCRSYQIEGDSFECEAGNVWQDIRCLECKKHWRDVFKLSDVQRVDG